MKVSGRWMCRWGGVLALALVLTSQVALAEGDAPALPGKAPPPSLRLFLGAAVTWRQYCARPGVESCQEFDALDPRQQRGDIADYSSQVPYAGFAVEAELFPLARHESLLRGLGLTLGYQRGFARATVQVSTPTGETPEREVFPTDTVYSAMVAYRYFLGLGLTEMPLWGHLGLRLGVRGRDFDLDEELSGPLPETHRLYPAVGLDVAVPLIRQVRVEGGGMVFLRPNPGASLFHEDGSLGSEVRDYGTSVSSLGWMAELGFAGELWGPVGYALRFRLEHDKDRFSGPGSRRLWTEGGVAEETYSSILAGVTASW